MEKLKQGKQYWETDRGRAETPSPLKVAPLVESYNIHKTSLSSHLEATLLPTTHIFLVPPTISLLSL
jgi:hypothetical protein